MIPKECKRLAEVDFPIAVVSKHAAREKSIRHGHPSTLHLWWARRPLAACRAMLMALLLPDPADPYCPDQFKVEARRLLAPIPVALEPDDDGLRKALLKFIGDFSNWDLSNNSLYVETARSLIKAAQGDEVPLVVDPFAGGGSIPLEALRLGCDAFASDLNPVACLILKVMLEDIPRWGREKIKVTRQNGEEIEADGLAEALRIVGKEIKEKAEQELKEFYPDDPDGSKPIAYLWARTVKCESPNCGAEIPLMRSLWLCKKANRKRALRFKVIRPDSGPPHVEFEIFEPKSDKEVQSGTVTRAKATCPCCGAVLQPERVRAQLSEQRGGADVIFDTNGNRIGGARMLAVVTLHSGIQGREYRLPEECDYKAVLKAQKQLKTILADWEMGGKMGLCPVPDEALPHRNTLGLRVPNYGVKTWGDIFSYRQKLALHSLTSSVLEMNGTLIPDVLKRSLSLAVSRTADYCSANCSLHVGRDVVRNTWARNALPIVWDFYEINPFGDGSGNFGGALDWVSWVAENGIYFKGNKGSVEQVDAAESPLPDQSTIIWFTDPPYYNAIGYAESSDFFYVWLKRASSDNTFITNTFEPDSPVTPKKREAIQDDTFEVVYGSRKDSSFFEAKMFTAFNEGRRITRDDGIASVVFAHKTTQGWESLLASILHAGWTVTGSWPIQTEMENKVSGSQAGEKKAMLLASVHLVCRPRPKDAPVGDWSSVIKELPARVGTWMERLQGEGVRGADLVFACIGPALEIYSRYSKVVDAEDREIPLGGDPIATEPHKRGYLAYVWEAVGKAALEQVLGTAETEARNSAGGALEEDARLTALFLWTLQSTNGNSEGKSKKGKGKSSEDEDEEIGEVEEDEEDLAQKRKKGGFSLIFDVVRRFAQPLGIRLPDWEGRIIETEKGIVRLLEESSPRDMQLKLFPREAEGSIPKIQGRGGKRSKRFGTDVSDEDLRSRKEATTLDRVHAAMLLQAGGRANALRALLKAEVERGPDFLRLANALSALYPKTSEEKRLVDAMLLAVPR